MSSIRLSPYINFQGRAREAMEWYRKVLGGTIEMHALNERGEPQPAGPGDSIRHARLESGGAVILATDGHPDYPPRAGDHMAVALNGTDRSRLARIFDDLSDGGRIQMPLTPQPWGGESGWLVDRFGISWTVTLENA